jgi:type IV pilus assembly protein PilE
MFPEPRAGVAVGRPRAGALAGFTLIEMMIVVAVIAILAAIVIPSYQGSVRKARRTDAKTALTTIAQLMERYNTQSNTYVGATLGACNGSTTGTIPYRACSENGYYTLALSNLAASTFTVTATPTGSQTSDTACSTFTLDQAGARGPSSTLATCW